MYWYLYKLYTIQMLGVRIPGSEWVDWCLARGASGRHGAKIHSFIHTMEGTRNHREVISTQKPSRNWYTKLKSLLKWGYTRTNNSFLQKAGVPSLNICQVYLVAIHLSISSNVNLWSPSIPRCVMTGKAPTCTDRTWTCFEDHAGSQWSLVGSYLNQVGTVDRRNPS